MEERNIKISLEKAREWYKSDDSFKKELALQAFTEEELTKVELPKTFEEYLSTLSKEKADKIRNNCDILSITDPQLCKVYKLKLLRNYYRKYEENIEVNYRNFSICNYENKPVSMSSTLGRFLSFKSNDLRDKFLENFRDLIKQARDLI